MDKWCPFCGAELRRVGAYACGTQVNTKSRSGDCYETQLAALQARLAEAEGLLKMVEDFAFHESGESGEILEEPWCGLCGLPINDGHTINCPYPMIQAFLSGQDTGKVVK